MRVQLPLLLLLASCSGAPEDPTLPDWSKDQIASLRQWAANAPEDALPLFDTAELDAATAKWGAGEEKRRAATVLAEKLARAHLHGCAAGEERDEWFMKDEEDSAELRGRLTQALERGENLDSFFQGLRPAHPDYASLRTAFAAEIDPARRTTIARNLERWRWLPRELGQDYVLVNVPAFEVYLWRGGAQAKSWRAVVGRKETPTPQIAAPIKAVTFNPWWYLPNSIVEAGGRFSPRQGYVRMKNGQIRQKPGPRNALGQVKVEMPNPYAIYLHDTPSRGLFGATYRAYSHGCVRVGDALGLAETLLEGVKTRDDIDVMLGIKTREEVLGLISKAPIPPKPEPKPKEPPEIKTATIKLQAELPAYIAYFTAAPRPDGSLAFPRDLYKRDAKIEDPSNPGRACNAGYATYRPQLPSPAKNESQGDQGP